MKKKIKTYPVKHPLLRKYIKFFWEIRDDHMELNHKLIPVRNIDLKFNLGETPHFLIHNGNQYLLEETYFSGLQDHFRNAQLVSSGKVHVLGICFLPEGFYPFLKIPVSEFKNQLLGADEVGFYAAARINERLKTASGVAARLNILEEELLRLLDGVNNTPLFFQQIFNALKKADNTLQIAEFCKLNNIGIRKLERMYNKYVGVSAKTYGLLNRFQDSLNQLLHSDYIKLSDIAYGNEYFDQMHFIREFKRFAGNTPKKFVAQNNTMLQIGKFV